MSDYIKPNEKGLQYWYLRPTCWNKLTLSDTPEQIAEHIFDIVSSLKTDSNTVIVSNIV